MLRTRSGKLIAMMLLCLSLSALRAADPVFPQTSEPSLLVDKRRSAEPEQDYYKSFMNMWQAAGFSITYATSDLDSYDLNRYNVLMIIEPWPSQLGAFPSATVARIVDYLKNGGGLLIADEYRFDPASPSQANEVTGDFGISFGSEDWPPGPYGGDNPASVVVTDFTTHPITNGLRSIYVVDLASPITTTGRAVQLCSFKGKALMAAFESGPTRVFAVGDFEMFGEGALDEHDNRILVRNVIQWFLGYSMPPQTSSTAAPGTAGRETNIGSLQSGQSLSNALPWIVLVAIGAVIGFLVVRRRGGAGKQVSATQVMIPPEAFDISVTVPSVGKTVTLEVASDHTMKSLVETIVSTLNLPKDRTYTVEHAGEHINPPGFGKSLGNLGISERSKLTLRAVE